MIGYDCAVCNRRISVAEIDREETYRRYKPVCKDCAESFRIKIRNMVDETIESILARNERTIDIG